MGKILLLGGTGALGNYLSKELEGSEHEVFITSRSAHENYGNIRYIQGNAKQDEAFFDDLLKEHFDCIVDFMVWPTEQFRHQYQKMIEKTGHYVYLSSYRAYADGGLTPLNEDSPLLLDVTKDQEYLKTDEYALAKAREERVLKDSKYGNWSILRPSITFSKSRFQIGTLEAGSIIPRAIQRKPLILPREMMSKRAAVSWAGDVGRMMAFLLGNDRAKKEVFNVASSESHTWNTIASYYHDIIGTDVILTSVDNYIKVVRGKYQVMYDRMFDRVVDNSKILDLMGLTQTDLTPIRDALALELADVNKVAARVKEDKPLCERMDRQLMVHHPLEVLRHKLRLGGAPSFEEPAVSQPEKENSSEKNVAENQNKTTGKVGILNFHFANNYGAVLVPFALSKAVERLGYQPEIINYIAQNFSDQPAFSRFRGKYLSCSKEYISMAQLRQTPDAWERVIVGSDQVWRMFRTDIYMLEWASGRTSLISYAASFGHDYYQGTIPASYACDLLKRFDAVSVREDSGVDVCRMLGREAVQVLDPTFLLEAADYDKVIEAEPVRVPSEPYVCGIFLSAASAKYIKNANMFLDIRSKCKLIDPIKDENGKFRPVAEWLALIKNARYVITDSFHGAVFSIIFNKQFVTLMHEGFNGNARIPSLLESLGIPQNRIVFSSEAITMDTFKEEIDYSIVNAKLAAERDKARLFLKEALALEPSYKAPFVPTDPAKAFGHIDIAQPEGMGDEEWAFTRSYIRLRLSEGAALRGRVAKLEKRMTELEKKAAKSKSGKAKFKYKLYKLLSKISFGKMRDKFKAKSEKYKARVK